MHYMGNWGRHVVAASLEIRTVVRELGDRDLGVTGGSALTLNRRPEVPVPASTGNEISAMNLSAPPNASTPARVSRCVAREVTP